MKIASRNILPGGKLYLFLVDWVLLLLYIDYWQVFGAFYVNRGYIRTDLYFTVILFLKIIAAGFQIDLKI